MIIEWLGMTNHLLYTDELVKTNAWISVGIEIR